MEQSLKNKLNRNIWITRKCRINASERLLSYAKYIEILNVYYSIFVIILSKDLFGHTMKLQRMLVVQIIY